MITPQKAADVLANAERLYTQREVELALDSMAEKISRRLSEENPLVLCVLNGALIPMGQLLTRLPFPLRQDYLHATRYRGDTTGNELNWIVHPGSSLAGETILVVDDILDEGITLAAIINHCRKAGAKSVYSAVLVEKKHKRGNGFKADFVGLEVPDSYVFGYGMDYKEFLRNAPGIFVVKEDG